MTKQTNIPKATMIIAWVVVFGAMAPLLDSTMINIAINDLANSFHSNVTTVQWTVTGYLLATGVAVPFSSWLLNKFDGKFVFMAGEILFGIVSVSKLNESDYSYQMPYMGTNLKSYIKENDLRDEEKLDIVKQIFQIMAKVHHRNIIHRDLNPNNIWYEHGNIIISDFGLGKSVVDVDLTTATVGIGTLGYMAPEQKTMLRDASMEADVFSLGKIINFIFTKNYDDSRHLLQNITNKATVRSPNDRFANIFDMHLKFEEQIKNLESDQNEKNIIRKINSGTIDEQVKNYILSIPIDKLINLFLKTENLENVLFQLIRSNEILNADLVNEIFKELQAESLQFEQYDRFSDLARNLLGISDIEYQIMVDSAHLLKFVAKDMADCKK